MTELPRVVGSSNWNSSPLPAGFSLEPGQCRNGIFSIDYSTDRNFDGAFTFSDLKLVIHDFLSVPADLFRAWIYGTDFGKFFEVRCSETEGITFLISAATVIALVYSIIEASSLYLQRSERRSIEGWLEKERKEKGYEVPNSESPKE